MKVFIYECTDPDLPNLTRGKDEDKVVLGKAAFLARIRCAVMGQGGKLVEDWHPILITSHTAEEARRKAETWWAEQVEAERAKTRKAKDGPSPTVLTPAPVGNAAEAI